MDREAVQMADVEGAKVCVKRVVEKSIINCKIYRASFLRRGSSLRSALAWRLGLLGRIGEWSSGVWGVIVRGQVQLV